MSCVRAQSDRGVLRQTAPKDSGRRLALVIGNNKYADAPLQNADNDAIGMEEALDEVGFRVTKVLDADRSTFISKFGQFIGELHPGDSVLLYYAGHAIQIDGVNYLIPVGFSAASSFEAKGNAIDLNDLLAEMYRAEARVTVIILDACRTNPYSGARGSTGLSEVETGKGTFIAFATEPNKSASDDPGQPHGRFTGALLDALKLPGLTIDAVFNRVREQVVNDSNGGQIPWSHTALIGEFVFRAAPPAPNTAELLSEMNGIQELGARMNQAITHGQIDTAILLGKEAVNECQSYREKLRRVSESDQRQFAQFFEPIYRVLADTLAGAHRNSESTGVIGLLKEQETFNLLPAGQERGASNSIILTPAESRVEAQVHNTYPNILADAREWEALRAKAPRTPEEGERLAELSNELQVANQNTQKAFEEEFSNRPGKNAVEMSLGIQAVLRTMPTGTLALYTLVGDENLRIILISPNVEMSYEIPVKKTELRASVFSLVRALSNPDSNARASSVALYQLLIAPLERDLKDARATTLLWSLDDVLRYVPIGALYDGHEFIAERYDIALLTPGDFGQLKRRPSENPRAVIFGGSIGAADSVPRPGVRDEVKQIQAITNGTILLDKEFTRDSFEAALQGGHYSVVHVAADFVFETGRDSASYLICGNGEHLTLEEMRNKAISLHGVDLLVLSGSSVGLGLANSDGREFDGRNVTMQGLGASSLVSTLWGVNDLSTTKFMTSFYKSLWSGEGVARSLRLAQVEMLHTDKFAHPYYWAPFVLSGRWI